MDLILNIGFSEVAIYGICTMFLCLVLHSFFLSLTIKKDHKDATIYLSDRNVTPLTNPCIQYFRSGKRPRKNLGHLDS
jgi:hypothetical protein